MTGRMIMGRYERNMPAISPEEQAELAGKRVVIIGCGGLGGYIIELLARIGVGHLTVVDGDVFAESNLNRQLFSTEENLGQPKPLSAVRRLSIVNSEVSVRPIWEKLTEQNAEQILTGHDVAVDALDNGPSRLLLAAACRKVGIPLVSGSIGGWYGRVFVLEPEHRADFLWEDGNGQITFGNLSCTAACVASVQVAETVKVLLGRGRLLKSRLLELNLLQARWEEIPLDLS